MDEFKIIEKYIKTKPDPSVILGAGDDCCIIERDQSHYRITTSDALVEHKHFRLQDLTFEELGYKSLAVNLSDIAAMGGVAKWCQLTLVLPPTVKEADVDQFFKGFYSLAEKEGISLVGGDLSSSDRDVFINVTLSGIVEKEKIKTRQNFSRGEVLCVTGFLGESGAGLKSLLENRSEKYLRDKHIIPKAYHQEGQWLAKQKCIHGMMDLSDGLLSDLQRLEGGFEIDLDKLPLSSHLLKACEKYNWKAEELALSSGEDYVLLFSCDESSFDSLNTHYRQRFSKPLYKIGRISKKQGIHFMRNGNLEDVGYKAFSHF